MTDPERPSVSVDDVRHLGIAEAFGLRCCHCNEVATHRVRTITGRARTVYACEEWANALAAIRVVEGPDP